MEDSFDAGEGEADEDPGMDSPDEDIEDHNEDGDGEGTGITSAEGTVEFLDANMADEQIDAKRVRPEDRYQLWFFAFPW